MPVAHSSYETERVASDGCACAVWKVMKILNYAFQYQYKGSEAKALDLYSGVHIPANRRWRGDSSDPVPTANGPVPVGVEKMSPAFV
ncbi:hypothetical protein VNO80_33111 [Phaseolus coccineus]|uniref:Uncharacterized protein n=1 Tax=Phaseolus coccineus TaxID=3886 RepID=A0AAN9L0D3_PHACN